MATAKDILLSDTGEVSFFNGDFNFGESDQQDIVLLINTFVGNWKQSPTCGVGIIQYKCSSGQGGALRRSMEVQIKGDGFTINNISLTETPDDVFQYSIDAIRT